ncbi:MAG: hypothetical protein FRX49_01688 [Trebouxia sp. A1-2]|nr:MAG: hypothetical protein FRX49_01688 [Trebouxia sp. A1-2]
MRNKAYLIFILSGHPHSVKGGFQPAVAPVLQGIPNVDGDGPSDRVTGDPQPRLHSFFGGGTENLKGGRLESHQWLVVST